MNKRTERSEVVFHEELQASMKPALRRCGHPRTPENTHHKTNQRCPRGFEERCRTCYCGATARYEASDKRRAAQARYDASDKGLTRRRRWRESVKGTLYQMNWRRGQVGGGAA
jgi:hypothetical protein